MSFNMAPMGTKVRPIRFQDGLLAEVEARIGTDGDLSYFVNGAVDLALHGEEARPLRLVPEPAGLLELGAASEAFRDALLARDEPRARAIVEDLTGRGARVVDLYTLVLAPALHAIGDLWSLEQATVADEHYATELAIQLLGVLAPDRRMPPTRGRLAVVGASPDELHAIGCRMLADLLERAGWEVIALGAAVPADALAQLVTDECPDVVALSTSTVGRLPGAEEAVALLHRVRPRPLIALGGALYRGPVVQLARGWGADLVLDDLDTLLTELSRRFPPTG